MAKRTFYPAIPRKNPDKAINALTEASEILTGATGNGLDQAVTYRVLQDIGIIDFKRAFNGKITNVGAVIDEDDQSVDVPPMPVMLAVTGTFSTVLVEWIAAAYNGHAYTEVYRSSEDDLETASFLGASIHTSYTDFVGSGETNYYWIRFVNTNDLAGVYNSVAGTEGATLLTPQAVLEAYSQDIYEGEDYAWLTSELTMMDSLNRAFAAAGFDPDSGLANILNNSSSLTDLLAEQALSAALDKHTQTFEIKAQFSKNFARLSGGIHAAVEASESYIQRLAVLEAHWENDLGAAVDAKIEEYSLALASEGGAISTTVNNYTVAYDGNDASLQTLAEVVSSNSSNHARWGVKTDVNGKRGGVTFSNDGYITSMVINADLFTIADGASDIVPFVITGGQTVIAAALIDHAEIYTLIASNIVAENVKASLYMHSPIMSAGKVFGSAIQIGGSYVQVVDGVTGLVTDVLPDTDSPFQVDTNGYLQTVGATMKELTVIDSNGDIVLDANGISQTYIKDLLADQVISTKVYAENIEGDVTDSLSKDSTTNHAYSRDIVTFDVAPLPFARTFVISGGIVFHPKNVAGGEVFDQVSVALFKDSVQVDSQVVSPSRVTYIDTPSIEQSASTRPFVSTVAANESATFKINAISGYHYSQPVVAHVFKRGSTLS